MREFDRRQSLQNIQSTQSTASNASLTVNHNAVIAYRGQRRSILSALYSEKRSREFDRRRPLQILQSTQFATPNASTSRGTQVTAIAKKMWPNNTGSHTQTSKSVDQQRQNLIPIGNLRNLMIFSIHF